MKVFAMKVLSNNLAAGQRIAALAVGVTLTTLMASAAWAQVIPPNAPAGSGNIATGHGGAGGKAEAAPLRPPEAIPGAVARAPAAPATKGAADLQPNDALFDAINRGDIASARDALNRGADLNAVNILGMTPMELSVDLSRNDISFLLLSMRGEDSDRGSRAIGRDSTASGKASPAGKVVFSSKPAAGGKAARDRTAAATNVPAAAVRPVTPKLFANDGGTPLPNAGFLGFGSRSAPN
jgi:hypothetical protein